VVASGRRKDRAVIDTITMCGVLKQIPSVFYWDAAVGAMRGPGVSQLPLDLRTRHPGADVLAGDGEDVDVGVANATMDVAMERRALMDFVAAVRAVAFVGFGPSSFSQVVATYRLLLRNDSNSVLLRPFANVTHPHYTYKGFVGDVALCSDEGMCPANDAPVKLACGA
jgi:hypothetical protein